MNYNKYELINDFDKMKSIKYKICWGQYGIDYYKLDFMDNLTNLNVVNILKEKLNKIWSVVLIYKNDNIIYHYEKNYNYEYRLNKYLWNNVKEYAGIYNIKFNLKKLENYHFKLFMYVVFNDRMKTNNADIYTKFKEVEKLYLKILNCPNSIKDYDDKYHTHNLCFKKIFKYVYNTFFSYEIYEFLNFITTLKDYNYKKKYKVGEIIYYTNKKKIMNKYYDNFLTQFNCKRCKYYDEFLCGKIIKITEDTIKIKPFINIYHNILPYFKTAENRQNFINNNLIGYVYLDYYDCTNKNTTNYYNYPYYTPHPHTRDYLTNNSVFYYTIDIDYINCSINNKLINPQSEYFFITENTIPTILKPHFLNKNYKMGDFTHDLNIFKNPITEIHRTLYKDAKNPTQVNFNNNITYHRCIDNYLYELHYDIINNEKLKDKHIKYDNEKEYRNKYNWSNIKNPINNCFHSVFY